jgi:soluble lytic murein transglycosylase
VADPFNPHQNIMGGVRYLREMLERFGQDLQLALAAYNAGPGAVEQYRTIPPFPETQEYIQRVLRFYRLFQKV